MVSKISEDGFPVFILYFLQTSIIFCLLDSKIASCSVEILNDGGKKIKPLKLKLTRIHKYLSLKIEYVGIIKNIFGFNNV